MPTYKLADGTVTWKSGDSYGVGNSEYDKSSPRQLYYDAMAKYNQARTLAEKKKGIADYGVSLDDYTDAQGNVDREAYRQAQLAWMSGNYAFEGWTKDQMNSFLDTIGSGDYTDKQIQAAQIWESTGIGISNANAQKKADREDILAEIEAYKAGFSNEAISAAVSLERQAWDSKIQEVLNQAVNQAAAQGRVMDNTTYAILRGRLEAQAANAVQQVQMQYEQKRQEYMLSAIQLKNDVYKNTTNSVMDYKDAAEIIKSLSGSK